VSYCKNCGAELAEGVAYCSKCGTYIVVRTILANWGERFVAWIIDIIIIGILLLPLKFITWITWSSFTWTPQFLRWIPFFDFGVDNIFHFLYWTFLEGTNGRSLGKMIMKIKVTQLNGEHTGLTHAAIESLGKAFLLPLDCIIGCIFYPNKKQRLFNYISETIIVKVS